MHMELYEVSLVVKSPPTYRLFSGLTEIYVILLCSIGLLESTTVNVVPSNFIKLLVCVSSFILILMPAIYNILLLLTAKELMYSDKFNIIGVQTEPFHFFK